MTAAVVAAAAAAAEEVAAVVVATDLTAHLAGTADRLTVNWQWRLIGLLCQKNQPSLNHP